MTIQSKILVLINRLNQELDQTKQIAWQGLAIVRIFLVNFPNNAIFRQFYACINNILNLVELYKREFQNTVERLSTSDITEAEIQEAREDLGTLFGRVLETKIKVETVINRLERFR